MTGQEVTATGDNVEFDGPFRWQMRTETVDAYTCMTCGATVMQYAPPCINALGLHQEWHVEQAHIGSTEEVPDGHVR